MSHRRSPVTARDPSAPEPTAPATAPTAVVAGIPAATAGGGAGTARAVAAAAVTAPAATEPLAEPGGDEGQEAIAETVAVAAAVGEAYHSALDQSLMRGIAWTGSVKLTAQALTWASTIVVARLLTPRDYGLVGMATLYLGLVTLLSEFGIGSAIVALRHLSREQIAQINTLSVGFGAVGFVVSCLAAFPLAWFFKEPLLPPVLVALAGAFVIQSFRTVPYALLQRELRFKRLAVVEGAQAVLLAIASVAFALAGFHYWTLVISNLLSAIFSTAVVLYYHRHAFERPRREMLTEAITFGRNIIVSRLSFYWFSNADYLVAGKLLGNVALGAYQFGYNLAMTPLEKTSGLVLRVTPAIFSSVQTDKAALRRYLRGITEGISLVTFPLTIGLALVARDLVTVVLGAKWQSMIVPLQILASYAAFRSILPLARQLLVAARKAQVDASNALQTAIVMPAAFWAGSHWGITGIAAAWVLVHPYFGLRLIYQATGSIAMPAREYLGALWPALSSAAIMALAVAAVDFATPDSWPGVVGLVLKVAAGAAAYLATVFTLHRRRVAAFRQMWTTMRGQ